MEKTIYVQGIKCELNLDWSYDDNEMLEAATQDIENMINCGYFDSSTVSLIQLRDESLYVVGVDGNEGETGYYTWMSEMPGTDAVRVFGPYPNPFAAMWYMTGEMPEGVNKETAKEWIIEAGMHFEWDEEELNSVLEIFVGE